jgi:hypothetical protein
MVEGSFGQTLQLVSSGLIAAGDTNDVTFYEGVSTIDDFYKNGLISITAGTGVGQARSIIAYNGTTRTATVDRAWGTVPATNDTYMILPAAPSSSLTNAGIAGAVWDEALAGHLAFGSAGEKLNAPSVDNAAIAAAVWDEALSAHKADGSFGSTLQLLNYGSAVASGANDITLEAGSSSVDDYYKNALLVIIAGPGVGQARSIVGYVGATQVATVDRPWGATITTMSHYMIIPAANTPVDSAVIAGAVWDVAIASHVAPGTTGARLNYSGLPYVTFTSNGDTVLPIIYQVASPTHTTVRVTFSEPVVMTGGPNGALNVANYSIPGLTITGIVSLTSQQVLLTTSAQAPNFLYSLTVTNVEDTQGNPIA